MTKALCSYLAALGQGRSHQQAVLEAAEAVAQEPWEVVRAGGLLARCTVAVAAERTGIRGDLGLCKPHSQHAVAIVEAGAPYPVIDRTRRRRMGAFDTGPVMARDLVQRAVCAWDKSPESGLDPACGSGAFLLAMSEQGVKTIFGTDQDPLALEVARVAVPQAHLEIADALDEGFPVDLVCGNPPFIPPERQPEAVRAKARRRFPWLSGRFDLVVPFAASAAERCRVGGRVALIVPASMLTQPYGVGLRREWLQSHRVLSLTPPEDFPGASVKVTSFIMERGGGPAPWPCEDLSAADLLGLENAPWHTAVRRADLALVRRIRDRSCALGEHCLVDTGVVAHLPGGSKKHLLEDEPRHGLVPYADAREFFSGERRWLDYRPEAMHRAKRPSMFEEPKIVIQRLRGKRPIRAEVDRTGTYLGHTCTIVQPHSEEAPSLERLTELVCSPVVDAVTRVERGGRLDLYPKDVAAFPLPLAWLEDASITLEAAFDLLPGEVSRLEEIATQL
jgi:hypothetical protein